VGRVAFSIILNTRSIITVSQNPFDPPREDGIDDGSNFSIRRRETKNFATSLGVVDAKDCIPGMTSNYC